MMNLGTKKLIYIIVGLVILAVLYALKNTNYFARALGFIVSMALFYLIDAILNLKFKNVHYLIVIFITATGILFSQLYWKYPNYDKILHFINPLLICILIFYLLGKARIDVRLKVYLTFAILVSVITLWEVVEFSLDKLYNLRLQGVWVRDVTGLEKLNLIMDKNDDTMLDIILGIVGALFFTLYKSISNHLGMYVFSYGSSIRKV